MANKTNRNPTAALRVFVSSTYSDMRQYRDAIISALNKADCIAYGMERFGAASVPPLDVCYEELNKSQIYICALGMRYGSIDEKSGKSYTQLEYEKAQELGIPILAFLIDEDNVKISIRDIDRGELGDKLADFKKSVKESKEVTCAFFDSPMALQEMVYRSVLAEIKRQDTYSETSDIDNHDDNDYKLGAKTYRKFVRRPERFKNTEVFLRVRMDGLYSGWKLKDQLYEVYGMRSGDALYLNDLWVLGLNNIDVDNDLWEIDCFAQGDAADWLDDNEVTKGTIFEGIFQMMYELVPRITSTGDAKIAKLVLKKGSRVIEHGVVSGRNVLTDSVLEDTDSGNLITQFRSLLQDMNTQATTS